MLKQFRIDTDNNRFYNITANVMKAVEESGVKDGVCIVYCPHTTAGITINENSDPDVTKDILYALDKSFPDYPQFRHAEGNSSAHMKASVMGSSATVIIEDRNLLLGIWQGIYFCEFDGPRRRKYYVKII